MKTAIALASITLAALPLHAQTEVGDQPSHTFRSPLVNGPLVSSLEDFRGRPLLVDFWGTR